MSGTNKKRKSTSMIPKLNTLERRKSAPRNVETQVQPSCSLDTYKRISPSRAQFESRRLQSACMFMKLLKENIETTSSTNTNQGPENNAISDLLDAIFDISDSLTPIVNTVSKSTYSSSDFPNSCSDSSISEHHFNNTMKATSKFFEMTKKSTIHAEWNAQSYYYAQQIIANNMEESNLITRGLREVGDKIYIDRGLYNQLIDLHNLLNDTIIKLRNKEREVNEKAVHGSQQTYLVSSSEEHPYKDSSPTTVNAMTSVTQSAHSSNVASPKTSVTYQVKAEQYSYSYDPEETTKSRQHFDDDIKTETWQIQEENQMHPNTNVKSEPAVKMEPSHSNTTTNSGQDIKKEEYFDADIKTETLHAQQEKDMYTEADLKSGQNIIKEEYSDGDIKTEKMYNKEGIDYDADETIKSERVLKTEPRPSNKSSNSELNEQTDVGGTTSDSNEGVNTARFADGCTCNDEDVTPKKAKFYERANIKRFRKVGQESPKTPVNSNDEIGKQQTYHRVAISFTDANDGVNTSSFNTDRLANRCTCDADEDVKPKKARFYDTSNIKPFRKVQRESLPPPDHSSQDKDYDNNYGKKTEKKPLLGLFGKIHDISSKHIAVNRRAGQPEKEKDDPKPGFLSKFQRTMRSQVNKTEIMKKFNKKEKTRRNDKPWMGGAPVPANLPENMVWYLKCIEQLNELKMCLESAVNDGVDISDQVKFGRDNTRKNTDCARFHTTIDEIPIVIMFAKDRKILPTRSRSTNSDLHVGDISRKTVTYDIYPNRSKNQVESFIIENSKYSVNYSSDTKSKTYYTDSDSSPDIPYTADHASLPRIEVPGNFCPSLDFDVTTVESTLRDTGINHPDGNALKSLLHFPINNIIESCRPAKCCRKTILNGKPRGNMPYAASLKSLPLVNVDIERVKQIIQSNVKFNTYPTYPIFEHYINFQKNVTNVKFACSIPTPHFEVRFFELFKKEERKDGGEGGTKSSTHELKILDFIRKIYTSEPVPHKRAREHRDKNVKHSHHHKHRKHRKLETKRCRVESYLPPKPSFFTTSSSSFLPSTASLPPAIRRNGNESMQSFLLIPKSELSTYFSGEMSTTYTPSANSLPLDEIDICRNLSKVLSAIRVENRIGDDIDESSLTPGNYAETLDAIYELDQNGRMRPKSINLLKPHYSSQPIKENVNLTSIQSSLSTIQESDEKGRRKENEDDQEQGLLASPQRNSNNVVPMEGSEVATVLHHSNSHGHHQRTLSKHKSLANCNDTCFDQKGPVYQQAFGIGPINKLVTNTVYSDTSEADGIKKMNLESSTDATSTSSNSKDQGSDKKHKTKSTVEKKSHKLTAPNSKRPPKPDHKSKISRENIKDVNRSDILKNVTKKDLVAKSAESFNPPPQAVDRTCSKIQRDQKIQIENNVVAYVVNASDSKMLEKRLPKESGDGKSANVCSWPPVKKSVLEVVPARNKNAFFVSVHQNKLSTDMISNQATGEILNNDTQKLQDVCKKCTGISTSFANELNDKVTQFPEFKGRCKVCHSTLDKKKYKLANLSHDNFMIGYTGSQTECKGILKDSITDNKGSKKNKKKKVKHATPEVIDIKMAKNVKSTILQHSFYNGHDRPGYVTVLKTPCNCPDITIFIPCYCGNYKCIKSPTPYERINDYAMIPLTEQSDEEGKCL